MMTKPYAFESAWHHISEHFGRGSSEQTLQLFVSLQGVWASKYNERALLSMKKVGLDFNDLRMAVLVQRVVPAEYAYVIHTHNPANGSADEIYAEVVRGLGEAIVSGMVPGSSLAFMAPKTDLDNPQVSVAQSSTLLSPNARVTKLWRNCQA